MNTRTALTLIIAVLLVHLTVVALLVYALTHTHTVSFPLVPRTSGTTPAANGALGLTLTASSYSLREALPVVPARGHFPAPSPAVTNQPASGSRDARAVGVFSREFGVFSRDVLPDHRSYAAATAIAVNAAGGLQFLRSLAPKASSLQLSIPPDEKSAAGAARVTRRMFMSGHLAMAVSASPGRALS